jgi:glyoxylase-like metal-dependent hydrolase (beta-lactamase superfamily II)
VSAIGSTSRVDAVFASAAPSRAAPGTTGVVRVRRACEVVIEPFFDASTSTLTYLVYDDGSRVGVVIDSVADFDARRARLSDTSSERIAKLIERRSIDVQYVLDTHVHADHVTGMPFFEDRYGARSVIGAKVAEVQRTFRDLFGLGSEFPTDGRQFDVLLDDGETLQVGPFAIEAMHTPGHTPACLSYRIRDAVFVGDTLFPPDYGVARCDFPGGSAEALFESIQRLYALPGLTRVFTGHDYRPGGRAISAESTIAEQRAKNVQLRADTRRAPFLSFRRERDATLAMPSLMLAAVQMNIRAGRPPDPDPDGVSYLRIPLNRF